MNDQCNWFVTSIHSECGSISRRLKEQTEYEVIIKWKKLELIKAATIIQLSFLLYPSDSHIHIHLASDKGIVKYFHNNLLSYDALKNFYQFDID